MNEWLSRTQLRQRPMLAVYAGMLIVITVIIGTAVLLRLSSPSSDRLAVIANMLSFGTLLLALVAGIVALAAYSAATGLPNLKLKFNDPYTLPGEIFFVTADPEQFPAYRGDIAAPVGDSIVKIAVKNTTRYAARTPAVIIEFRGCAIREELYGASNDWNATESHPVTGDVLAIQWDGGLNYAIHGDSTRHLPQLNLQGLFSDDDMPQIVVRLLADGYSRQEISLDVRLVDVSDLISEMPMVGAPRWL